MSRYTGGGKAKKKAPSRGFRRQRQTMTSESVSSVLTSSTSRINGRLPRRKLERLGLVLETGPSLAYDREIDDACGNSHSTNAKTLLIHKNVVYMHNLAARS